MSGISASSCASGVLRLWITHVKRWTCPRAIADAETLQGLTSSSPLSKKRGRSSFDGHWELHVEGAIVDDGCQGKSEGGGEHFSEVVSRVEITLDRKLVNGAMLTWVPPMQRTTVGGFIVQRPCRRGTRSCHVRLALSLRCAPKRFKLSPLLSKIIKLRHSSESKKQTVAALGRYIERLQLRDIKDSRVHSRVRSHMACKVNSQM